MQALHALALDPVVGARADRDSLGFGRGRRARDAHQEPFVSPARKGSPAWELEGDVKGRLDSMFHERLVYVN